MIASYINPEIIIPADSVGIDRAIGNIQTRLGEKLTWVEKIFGKCTIQYEVMKQSTDKTSKAKETAFPQVYSKTGEPYNLMMNDNLKSYCFFVAHDPGVFQDYNFSANQNYIDRKISIIFWMNVHKINPAAKGPFNEELIISVIQALKFLPDFKVTEVFETYKKIYEGFSIDENLRQYMKFPYSGFRIDGEITFPLFPENC